ncbi:TonB-dependent receptor [Pontibacter sp. SGAir0037]|uniref:TonB-dependent receptor n=1 Tax=Pontibacter sp. SGAir0037 TaxID=2571030 RepID=UPI0010CD52A9|nr:TonB-dependent receptor [Pontibacter sp. SGAir0037]QCR24822.1 TonB-dependent receptor [Pontibacter sp. SGAir0037]
MKQYYLLIIMLVYPIVLSAQHGRLQGTVTTAKGAVAYANVGLSNTTLGASTDRAGKFTIDQVPEGTHTLKVKAMGSPRFKELEVQVKAGEVTEVQVVLPESLTELQEVVVSGTMRETFLSESTVPVEVYTPKYFLKNPTPSLFNALEIVNGVQPQLNCNVCGTGDIHINGMEGAYTMVLIDGMPIVSALSTVYGLSGIPNSLVERVEVVKGPASTLYGSEAVAGLINIITKSPLTAPVATADVFYTSHQELSADIGFSKRFTKASSLVSANYYRFSDRRDVNGDNFTDVPLQHRISLFNKWSLNRPGNKVASLAVRYYYEDRFGGELQWTPAHRGGDEVYGESVYTRRLEVLGAYQMPGAEHVMLNYSFNDHDQNAAYGAEAFKARQKVLFGQLVWSKAIGDRHNFLAGTALRYTFYDDNTPATQSAVAHQPENEPVHTLLPGLFLQDEWNVSAATTLLTGLRYDYNSEHGSIFTPRINLKWSPNQQSSWRFSLGNGYRVVNLFTEDHAALTGAREVVVKEELKPERSYNANVNYQHFINMAAGYMQLQASVFYTYFTNKIVADFLTDNNLILYDNLSGYAISKGVALDAEMRFNFPFRLNAGLTLMDVYQVQASEVKAKERIPQLHAPAVSATFAASYELKGAGLSVDYTGSIRGPMRLPVQENDFRPAKSPWFTLQHVQLTKLLGNGVEVYGGIKNIFNFMPKHPLMRPFDPFDKEVEVNNPYNYSFDTEYNYAPLQGRRLFMGLRYTLLN